MDLLFQRYASPFLLYDELIVNHQAFDYTKSLLDEINEDKIYDLWLHKGYDKSYADFKKMCMTPKSHREKVDVNRILTNSMEVMGEITPQ